MHILSSFISKFYKFLLWFHSKILWSADICTVKDVESVNCIQYTLFYSNYGDSTKYANADYKKIWYDKKRGYLQYPQTTHLSERSVFIWKTPVYNFINDRLVDESAVLRPLSWHLILYVFRYFSRKWQKISDCECPDLIQNETPVRFLYGTQKKIRSDRAESSWHSNWC